MSELIKNIFEIKKSKPYIDYNKYHRGNIFGITKMSRRELMHSNFIAWALNSDSSHALRFYPIYQFVRSLSIIQAGVDNTNARKIDTSLIYNFFDDDFIVDMTIMREFPVAVGGSTKYIDLVIEIVTKDKVLPVIIENKVESKENGSNNDQTVVYFDWCEKNRYADRTTYYDPLYIFLYPEYNAAMQKSKEYIRMTYQELVNYILEPSMEKCGDLVSINNYKAYLQCLSFQADNEKGEYTMAISSEERKILDDFIRENKNLLCAVLNELKDDVADPSALSVITNTVRDYSKYNFDGSEYNKSRLVLAIVKKYISDNPSANYSDLQNVFPIRLSSKPLVRLKTDVTATELKNRRVFVNDMITLGDGTDIFVNSQVQEKDMLTILQIANNMGYIVSKT